MCWPESLNSPPVVHTVHNYDSPGCRAREEPEYAVALLLSLSSDICPFWHCMSTTIQEPALEL